MFPLILFNGDVRVLLVVHRVIVRDHIQRLVNVRVQNRFENVVLVNGVVVELEFQRITSTDEVCADYQRCYAVHITVQLQLALGRVDKLDVVCVGVGSIVENLIFV